MPITSKANAAPAETVQSKNARREAEIALAMKQEAERRDDRGAVTQARDREAIQKRAISERTTDADFRALRIPDAKGLFHLRER